MSSQTKDPNTAMIIEILAGYFGFLGIGYLYVGKTAAGLLRLVGWWLILLLLVLGGAFGPILAVFGSSMDDPSAGITAGIFSLCIFGILTIVVLAVPIISGIMLKRSLR